MRGQNEPSVFFKQPIGNLFNCCWPVPSICRGLFAEIDNLRGEWEMVALKTLIFTVVAPGTVTVYIPYLLLFSAKAAQRLPLGVFRYFGVVLILIGAAVYLRCAWDFTFTGRGTPAPIDPPKELVVRGLYRCVRNPMYVGVLTVLIGEAIFFASSRLFGYAGMVFLCFHLFVMLYEEPALRRKFGESYQSYCAASRKT